MTWEICLGIIALAGFIITVGKIISNNTIAMTEVRCSIDKLKETMSEQKRCIEKITDSIKDHETRIQIIEHDINEN